MDRIEEELWREARELARGEGLRIEGLGTFHGTSFEAGAAPGPTGYDAPKLVVRVADRLGAEDDEVRSRLKAAVKGALDSGVSRPAPLGRLGLIEGTRDRLRWWPWRLEGDAPPDAVEQILAAWRTPADAVERILAAWRTPADDLAERVGAAIAAMDTVAGALSPADQARVLDELDYDLDEPDWRRFGDRIAGALPI